MNPLRLASLAASPFCSRKKGRSEGIHYGPLTGKSVAELITDGATSTDISAIDAGRLA